MVHNASQILLTGVRVDLPGQLRERSIGNGQVSAANLLVLDADVLPSDVLVVAENGEAFRKNDNGVALDDVPDSGVASGSIVEVGIEFVGHSGRAVVDHLHLVEDLGVFDVDL